jgi:hypothetical protein
MAVREQTRSDAVAAEDSNIEDHRFGNVLTLVFSVHFVQQTPALKPNRPFRKVRHVTHKPHIDVGYDKHDINFE